MKRGDSFKAQKSTNEIRALLKNANLDFEVVQNQALNDYLHKIFFSCPFTDELCIQQMQCVGCSISQTYATIKRK